MSALAKYLMRTAAAKGFKTVNIECINDRVSVGSENSLCGILLMKSQCTDIASTACLGEPAKTLSRRGHC